MKRPEEKPAISIAQLPEGWSGIVGAVAKRDGHAVRAGAGATIEVQSINDGEFRPLLLPGGGVAFATDAERDAVLAEIWKGAAG